MIDFVARNIKAKEFQAKAQVIDTTGMTSRLRLFSGGTGVDVAFASSTVV
jgi:hypothetical protein